MKVILLQDIENLGKKYEVKEVKPGHARNFLIPQNLVKPATKPNLKWLEAQKEIIQKEAEEDLKKYQEIASKIDDLDVEIIVKVGDEGQLFESVTSQKVSERLKEMGFDVKKSQVDIKEPIKAIGEFKVKINLAHNLEAEINLEIIAEKSDKPEEE
jgi:large subunit ribosomal protein L9